ncbi:MAG: adenosylcobinamide amidohydrolase [Candidatus Accumulibacter sp.]|jgi:adenosylcobinamide amidohydrolase|nr:adenosylcobinamide amidohydrolase [Accumulibacter sp.]
MEATRHGSPTENCSDPSPTPLDRGMRLFGFARRALFPLFLLLLNFVSRALFAAEPLVPLAVPLPANLTASAQVIENERDGLWEKTLIVSFPEARRAISTQEGFVVARAAVNHAMHPLLSRHFMSDMRAWDVYIDRIHGKIARSLKTQRRRLATMGTSADMENLAVVTKEYGPFTVTALVTGGAETNALRTGLDEGTHIETSHGTINILLLTNARLSDGAIARAIITVTEAKTAALEDLKVPSSTTKSAQATGTGTDNVIVVSGVSGPRVTYTGGHSRIGELIGKAAYGAVIEALGKQNGFLLPGAEPYVTKGSLKRQAAFESAEKWLSTLDDGELAAAWDAASALAKRTKTREAWDEALTKSRAGLGKAIARKTSRNLPTRALDGLPRGEYMLLEFVSRFENREDLVERITARQDEDGIWRVVDYSIDLQERED